MAIDPNIGPDNPSADYQAMSKYWADIDAILGGASTMRNERFLHSFGDEAPLDYARRVACAPFTNIYDDISSNLSSKPFSRELALKEGSPAVYEALAEDIDGLGNNLHNFAQSSFKRGIDKGLDWIMVDYTQARDLVGRPVTVAESKRRGLRPYWVAIPAEDLLAAYSCWVGAREVFVHVRISETVVTRIGYGSGVKQRVREFNREDLGDGLLGPPTYQLWERVPGGTGKAAWICIEGPTELGVAEIPLVGFCPIQRSGTSWLVAPPLRKIADLQISEFQIESGLQVALEYTAFPMLAALGVDVASLAADNGRLPIGPKALLTSPPAVEGKVGEWKWVEFSGASVAALETRLEAMQRNMRDLGLQPLTQANLTVITTANVAMKAHSAIAAWTLRFKDALEQALRFTAMWLGDEANAPEVDIFQNFGVDLDGKFELDTLAKLQAQGVLSKQTVQEELRRRGVLSENFDVDEELKRLKQDQRGATPLAAVDPATGERVEPLTRPLLRGR